MNKSQKKWLTLAPIVAARMRARTRDGDHVDIDEYRCVSNTGLIYSAKLDR